jgi:hypothetical protein
VAEKAKPRKIEITKGEAGAEAITAHKEEPAGSSA